MKIINKIINKAHVLWYDFRDSFDYIERNIDFIWGISACDAPSSLYQSNVIDVVYDKKKKKYMLGVETAFLFDDKKKECEYLVEMLGEFTKYMESKGLDTKSEHVFFCSRLTIDSTADSIEELYADFNIFVKGYCSVYGDGK